MNEITGKIQMTEAVKYSNMSYVHLYTEYSVGLHSDICYAELFRLSGYTLRIEISSSRMKNPRIDFLTTNEYQIRGWACLLETARSNMRTSENLYYLPGMKNINTMKSDDIAKIVGDSFLDDRNDLLNKAAMVLGFDPR